MLEAGCSNHTLPNGGCGGAGRLASTEDALEELSQLRVVVEELAPGHHGDF